MASKQHLEIVLPACMADVPVRIIRKSHCNEIVLHLVSEDVDIEVSRDVIPKYAFIRNYDHYLKVALDEIEWIGAEGSYSVIHLTNNRKQIVSFNLAVIQKELPDDVFIRIHRSYIVNFSLVEHLIGNMLSVGNDYIPIGREYKDAVFRRAVILGVRKPK